MKKLLALTVAGALAIGGTALAGTTTLHLSASKTDFKFNTRTLTARAGTVTLAMFNPAGTQHGIAVQGEGIDKDGKIVGKGKTSVVTVKLKPGRYTFYCPVPGHRAFGMKGTLLVK